MTVPKASRSWLLRQLARATDQRSRSALSTANEALDNLARLAGGNGFMDVAREARHAQTMVEQAVNAMAAAEREAELMIRKLGYEK